jgi:hypothetical protein
LWARSFIVIYKYDYKKIIVWDIRQGVSHVSSLDVVLNFDNTFSNTYILEVSYFMHIYRRSLSRDLAIGKRTKWCGFSYRSPPPQLQAQPPKKSKTGDISSPWLT